MNLNTKDKLIVITIALITIVAAVWYCWPNSEELQSKMQSLETENKDLTFGTDELNKVIQDELGEKTESGRIIVFKDHTLDKGTATFIFDKGSYKLFITYEENRDDNYLMTYHIKNSETGKWMSLSKGNQDLIKENYAVECTFDMPDGSTMRFTYVLISGTDKSVHISSTFSYINPEETEDLLIKYLTLEKGATTFIYSINNFEVFFTYDEKRGNEYLILYDIRDGKTGNWVEFAYDESNRAPLSVGDFVEEGDSQRHLFEMPGGSVILFWYSVDKGTSASVDITCAVLVPPDSKIQI